MTATWEGARARSAALTSGLLASALALRRNAPTTRRICAALGGTGKPPPTFERSANTAKRARARFHTQLFVVATQASALDDHSLPLDPQQQQQKKERPSPPPTLFLAGRKKTAGGGVTVRRGGLRRCGDDGESAITHAPQSAHNHTSRSLLEGAARPRRRRVDGVPMEPRKQRRRIATATARQRMREIHCSLSTSDRGKHRSSRRKKENCAAARAHTHKHAHGTGAHTRVTRRPAASARNKRRRRPKASGDAQSFFLAGLRYSHGPVRIRLFFFRRWAEPAAASWVRVM